MQGEATRGMKGVARVAGEGWFTLARWLDDHRTIPETLYRRDDALLYMPM